MVRFALNIYGRFQFQLLCENADNLLVGWRLVPAPWAFYKSLRFIRLPAGQLSSALTSFRRVTALMPACKTARFGAVPLLLAILGRRCAATILLSSARLILLVLGPAWAPAGTNFHVFGPGVGIMPDLQHARLAFILSIEPRTAGSVGGGRVCRYRLAFCLD